MKRSSLIFALGGGLIGALLLRKEPLINVVHLHFDSVRPAIAPPPIVHVTIPSQTIINKGPDINNEEIIYPDNRFLHLKRIENEPLAEDFFDELIELVQPHMGSDRARTLRDALGLMHWYFAWWARELYKSPMTPNKG